MYIVKGGAVREMRGNRELLILVYIIAEQTIHTMQLACRARQRFLVHSNKWELSRWENRILRGAWFEAKDEPSQSFVFAHSDFRRWN